VTSNDFDQQVTSLAMLGDPVRRQLYRFVVAQPEPVSRERAAAGVGVAVHVAKFHLDRLEEDGLLEVESRRPPGRTGPGAGRPAKLYRRSTRDIAVSLPERRYDLAGRILAEAVSQAQRTGRSVDALVTEAARATGRALGEAARQAAEESPGPADPLDAASRALAANGYEPRLYSDGMTLANCPFHDLARSHPAIVCGLNLDLINGLLDALPAQGLCAVLDPAPGRCCVTVNVVPEPRPRD
jgi:predicted ArsR family transcriptional regulator